MKIRNSQRLTGPTLFAPWMHGKSGAAQNLAGASSIPDRSGALFSGESVSTIERLGGQTGWYYANWLWRMRGFLDLLFNGAGMRRGRRNPDRLMVGNTVDFWRVEEIQPEHLLRLRAEMRLPGRRLAAIRSRLPGLRVRCSTNSDFRSRRNNGPAVLVCALSAAPIRISRDAEGPRPR